MKRLVLFLILAGLVSIPMEAFAKKRSKIFKRKLGVSIVNAYTFHSYKDRPNVYAPKDAGRLITGDGQMYKFFSALEIARNYRNYEIGARIQLISTTFISPFLKWNLIKNDSRATIVPSLTIGLVPSQIMGGWLRAGLALSLNRYSSVEAFTGAYLWQKIGDIAEYEKNGYHFNAGLKINLYY